MTRAFLILIFFFLLLGSCKKDPDPVDIGFRACFTIEGDSLAGKAIVFNSSCSSDCDSLQWSFGDELYSTQPAPRHTYNTQGSFEISLTIYKDGNYDQITKRLTVTNPGYFSHNGIIEYNETWLKGIHMVEGNLVISGAKITVLPGSIIRMGTNASILIGMDEKPSDFIVQGTTTAPIIFTSEAASKSSKGSWGSIIFGKNTGKQSMLEGCLIEFGGGGDSTQAMVKLEQTNVQITNSTFNYSGNIGISLDSLSYFTSFTGNTFTDCNGPDILIHANHVHSISPANKFTTSKPIAIYGAIYSNPSSVWQKLNVPYNLTQSLTIGSLEGASLTVDPGITVQLSENVSINIGAQDKKGDLNAKGTEVESIVFTSSKKRKNKGDWNRIELSSYSTNATIIEHCHFEFGGGKNGSASVVISKNEATFNKNEILFSSGAGLKLNNTYIFNELMNNSFQFCNEYALDISSTAVHTIGLTNKFNDNKILVRNDNLTLPQITWKALPVPYVISGVLNVGSDNGTIWEIEAGTTLLFLSNSGLRIGYPLGKLAQLKATGTLANPIIFKSNAPENHGSPGQWQGIFFYAGVMSGSFLSNSKLSYGGGFSKNSGQIYAFDVGNRLEISNCSINYSASWGIMLVGNSNPYLSSNLFSGNKEGDVKFP